jgi:hypothetical protein
MSEVDPISNVSSSKQALRFWGIFLMYVIILIVLLDITGLTRWFNRWVGVIILAIGAIRLLSRAVRVERKRPDTMNVTDPSAQRIRSDSLTLLPNSDCHRPTASLTGTQTETQADRRDRSVISCGEP